MNVGKSRFLFLLPAIALCGCSLASYISASSGDYNVAVEDTTDSLLVTNVLRGGDSAPLFFSDLSQIRGSLQTSVQGQASWPFGPFVHDTMRTNSLQAGPMSVQTNPTFDIAPLNTKEFAQGINEPVSLSLMWYYLQRIDPGIILPLFISNIDVLPASADGTSAIPRTYSGVDPDRVKLMKRWIAGQDPTQPNDVRAYPARVNVYSGLTEFGPALSPAMLGERGILADLAQASTAGLQVKTGSDKKIHVYRKSTHAVLCVAPDPSVRPVQYHALAVATASVVSSPVAVEWPKSDDACQVRQESIDEPELPAKSAMPERIMVHLRSVEAMFYYLGGVVNRERSHSDDPLNESLHFHIYDHPIANERFHVTYRGAMYYVAKPSDDGDQMDYTVSILAILNDLLNMHRDANEIPTTKAVQSVP